MNLPYYVREMSEGRQPGPFLVIVAFSSQKNNIPWMYPGIYLAYWSHEKWADIYLLHTTVRYCYNAVNFLPNPHKYIP